MPNDWLDPASHYLIRRVRESDRDCLFSTGFQDFDDYDDPADYGTLRAYWKGDQHPTLPTPAYLLLELPQFPNQAAASILGVLRYRYEGHVASVQDLPPAGGPYLYLSRIGISDERQGMRLGSMLCEFFYHIVIRQMMTYKVPRLVLWWRATDRSLNLLKPFTKNGEVTVFAVKPSSKWNIEYDLKLEVEIEPG